MKRFLDFLQRNILFFGNSLLFSDGKVFLWGMLASNPEKNILIPQLFDLEERVIELSCRYRHCAAALLSGRAVTWGSNEYVPITHGHLFFLIESDSMCIHFFFCTDIIL